MVSDDPPHEAQLPAGCQLRSGYCQPRSAYGALTGETLRCRRRGQNRCLRRPGRTRTGNMATTATLGGRCSPRTPTSTASSCTTTTGAVGGSTEVTYLDLGESCYPRHRIWSSGVVIKTARPARRCPAGQWTRPTPAGPGAAGQTGRLTRTFRGSAICS